jgi:hypothetical protein
VPANAFVAASVSAALSAYRQMNLGGMMQGIATAIAIDSIEGPLGQAEDLPQHLNCRDHWLCDAAQAILYHLYVIAINECFV